MKKPNVLLTNDDGIHSKGLSYLWESLKDVASLKIVAPIEEQSGSGVGVTLNQLFEVKTIKDYKNTPAWKVNGKPVDCVKLALNALLKEKPDLIVSGINHGSNAGRNVLYSGTVGAIIEGIMRGIPGIAFSYVCNKKKTFPHIQPYILKIFQYFLKYSLPIGTLLNVNFPDIPSDQIKGCKMARQGLRYWMGTPQESLHPEGHLQFSLGWDEHVYDEHHESDIALLEEGYITVVPLSVGQLTDYKHLKEKKKLFDERILEF